MAQVLPYVQSPLEQLTPYIGQLGEGVREIGTKIANNRKSENFNKIINDPNSSDIQIANAFSQLPKDIKESSGPLYTQALRNRGQAAQQAGKVNEGLNTQGFKSSASRLRELLPKTGSSVFVSFPGTQTYQDRAEFDKLGFLLADNVYTHFNKGALTDKKFDYVKNELAPQAGLLQGENEARISALERIAGLPPDIDPEKLDSIIDKEVKSVKKSGKNKPTLNELFPYEGELSPSGLPQ